MHILENCLRKETYILLVIQKQTISTPRHFAAGGAFVPTQEKNKKKKTKTKTNHLNPTAFSPLGGGQNAHTRKKKQTFPSECRKILFKSECFGKVVLNSITVESFQVPTSDIILT